jgi:hypothetical protein
MDDPLRHWEGQARRVRRRRELKLPPVPSPLKPSVSRVTSTQSPQGLHQKVSGAPSEAHDTRTD